MNYYAIGIGGTGAKCIEALLHLSASGLMPKGKLYVLFIDVDQANRTVERATLLAQNYLGCKRVKFGSAELFKTDIELLQTGPWTPFEGGVAQPLDDFFKYNLIKQQNPNAAALFDVLYTDDEKTTKLDKGFLGRPSIGAAVFAKTVNFGDTEPWQTFWKKIEADTLTGIGARIFLFGSIFGGMGASGMPTVARLLKNRLDQDGGKLGANIGGALVQPYFTFDTPNDGGNDYKVMAEAKDFTVSTHAALDYYYNSGRLDAFDSVYTMGWDDQVKMPKTSIGGQNQENPPHLIDLYAALAAINFFTDGGNGHKCHKIAWSGNDNKGITWDDVQQETKNIPFKKNLGALVKLAVSFLGVYNPTLDNLLKNSDSMYRAPWYVDLMHPNSLTIDANKLASHRAEFSKYCESFLLWIANIHHFTGSRSINLINHNAFASYDQNANVMRPLTKPVFEEFPNLVMDDNDPFDLGTLWERMCSAKVKDTNAVDLGRLLNALYTECRG